MAPEILTPRQKRFISCVAAHSGFRSIFYLTGGTALAAYYLKHRYSEDLDFFSEQEITPLEVNAFIRSLRKKLGYGKADFQSSLNRNLIFLSFKGGPELKVEFTYYPGSPILPRRLVDGIFIDSLLDIAVNKAFTIAQNARTRDFIDLYLILKKEKWSFQELLKKARAKFDVYVDPMQVGPQMMKATEIRDYPRMIKKIRDDEWQDFFLKEAQKLKGQVLA